MHEWALAEAVLESVREHAAERRVLKVVLRMGELQQIDHEVFATGLAELGSTIGIDADVFEIEAEPARFSCLGCEGRWRLADLSPLDEEQGEAVHFVPEAFHAYLRCPGCGGPDLLVDSGRGVTIGTIEVEDDPEGGSA